ncbi:MAG: ligase-associated DNA damage response DEXH box helicase [Pseudomonadota bacterium]
MSDLVQETDATPDAVSPGTLPLPFQQWFDGKGWTPRDHQLALLQKAVEGRSALLIAPTGAGKTLAGFLPSLIALSNKTKHRPGMPIRGVHTLYVSPLKSLAVDIARNLTNPVSEMGLDIGIETRTGDTPSSKRQRQKLKPPDILLTTPEQLSLLLAAKDADRFFDDLETVIVDEIHTMVTSKRGDLLALGLQRLRTFRPGLRMVGLSATVSNPDELCRWLVAQDDPEDPPKADLVTVTGGALPDISILGTEARLPWSGHSARHAMSDIYDQIKEHNITLVFVNTRSQAELVFQELWRINEDNLAIALHHGSLDVAQRRKVERAMVEGNLQAVVCTATLDLGIDWGDVDLVVTVGAPKGASRLAQRIGRANHRMDEPSKALLVPANRFEVLECQAALDANYLGDQDTPAIQPGSLDVLAQHILGVACYKPFKADDLYHEIRQSYPYRELQRATFDKAIDFVATGGYALRSYERFAKIRETEDGTWRLSHPRVAQQYRLNIGTIVEMPVLNVRLSSAKRGTATRGGRVLGKIEEYFLETLAPGDTFLFAGQILKLEGIREADAIVSKSNAREPKIPYYAGGKFPLSTYLADKVRSMLAQPDAWDRLPGQVQEWLAIQEIKSILPKKDQLLVETFPRGDRFYLIAYPFEGRLAHQTLGMLLTRRLERARQRPLGFVATDYALGVWGLKDMGALDLETLFDEDMLGDDLEDWMGDSFLLKRTFRYCALISGLIEKNYPGKEKTGRQVTMSTDLIYDVLREHEPDHILMQATWADAARGLLDVRRLSEMLSRIRGRIVHKSLERISPLAVPIMLEVGKEPVFGEASDTIMAEASDVIVAEAMGDMETAEAAREAIRDRARRNQEKSTRDWRL